jgi:hypothetical protein
LLAVRPERRRESATHPTARIVGLRSPLMIAAVRFASKSMPIELLQYQQPTHLSWIRNHPGAERKIRKIDFFDNIDPTATLVAAHPHRIASVPPLLREERPMLRPATQVRLLGHGPLNPSGQWR